MKIRAFQIVVNVVPLSLCLGKAQQNYDWWQRIKSDPPLQGRHTELLPCVLLARHKFWCVPQISFSPPECSLLHQSHPGVIREEFIKFSTGKSKRHQNKHQLLLQTTLPGSFLGHYLETKGQWFPYPKGKPSSLKDVELQFWEAPHIYIWLIERLACTENMFI